MVVEVGKLMGGAYPQIIEKQEHIQKIIKLEEKKFHETINEGMKMANDIVATVKKEGKTHIPGHEAFVLYDTFGFPLDLTKDLAEENGIDVDTEGFQREMEEQRQRARAARDDAKGWDFSATFIGALGEIGKTTFIGYGQTSNETKLLSIIIGDKSVETASNGDDVFVLLKETPFYPEGGGQIGDQGEIANKNGRIEIIDTKKLPDGKIIHIGRVVEGSMRAGSMVSVSVNSHRRLNTARNHTATHLLHQALMDVLGDHVNQAGSLVTPQRLRFDFNHFNAVTSKEITQVEDIVNRQLLFGNHLKFFETSLEEAKELGAAALFGEKYGEKVRVVQIGDYSLELCGGTHVNSTSEIGILKIISEGGIGSGLRRIEAITGPEALNYLNTMESITKEIGNTLKTDSEHIISKVEQLIYENKEKSREIEKLSTRLASYQSQNLLDSIIDIEGVKLLAVKVDARNMDALRNMGDTFRTKLQSGVVVLGASIEDKASFLVMATKDVVDRGVHAGNIIRDVAKIAGGGGGGRPDMAQAGGKDPSKIEEALNAAKSIIQGQIK